MFGYGCKNILKCFRDGNVIVAGKKGNGKDLLFQYVINAREKKGEIHAATIPYTAQTKVRPISFYSLHNNGIKNFISGKFNTEAKHFVEKEDFYISDCGTSLPAQYNNELNKEYPTFPIVYALSRHLGDFNIHANTQNFNRIWDKLREQAEYYIYANRAYVIFHKIAIQSITLYTRYQSAVDGIQPYKVKRRFFGLKPAAPEDYSRATEYNAKYGTIRTYVFWHILPKIHYDTRIFHKKIFGECAPEIKKKKKKNSVTKAVSTSKDR